MDTLYILRETYTSGYINEVLDILYLIAILFGIIVVISKNPIHSVLFLIGLFLVISIYLILSGADFIGLSYLLVYVGAVSILFLFILMLINVRVSELLSNTNNSIPLAILITILFFYPLNGSISQDIADLKSKSIVSVMDISNYVYEKLNIKLNEFFLTTSQSWDGYLSDITHISSIGNIMYTSYSIWLILTSIILLLAMVGAIVITIKQK